MLGICRSSDVQHLALQALRLEPHHVVSNHTGIPLQLMHFHPDSMQETYGHKAGGTVKISRSTTPSGLPQARPAGPSGQPGLKGAVHEANVDWTSVLDLPAGSAGILQVQGGLQTRQLVCGCRVPSSPVL